MGMRNVSCRWMAFGLALLLSWSTVGGEGPSKPRESREEALDRNTAQTSDAALLRSRGVKLDAAGLIAFLARRSAPSEDCARIGGLIKQLSHRSFARREAASRQLIDIGPASLEA